LFDKCAFYPTFVDNHASIQVFLNMRPLRFLSFAVLIEMVLLSGCNPKTKTVQHRLVAIDSLMTKDPRAAWDTLAQFDFNLLREREKAYYGLLFTIAQHKNRIPFTDDSSITASRKWFETSHDYHNRARAYFYNGLVISKLSGKDTTALRYYQYACKTIDKYSIQDDRLAALVYSYRGRIHEHVLNLEEALNCYQKAVDYESKLGNIPNLLIDYCDLICCQVALGQKKEAAESIEDLDRVVVLHPEIQINAINNAKAIYYLHCDENLDSALVYCSKWKPASVDVGAKNKLLASIYTRKGELVNAIVYEKKAYEDQRKDEESYSHHYYHKLASLYDHIGETDSSAHYANLAYDALHNYIDQWTNKRVLELEKQYDLTAKEAELEKVQYHQRLLVMGLVALALLAGGLVLLLRNRSRELRAEKITRSFVQAAAKTHQNTLSLLKPLTTKPKSSTVEGLQASIAGIATDLRKGFTKNFSEAIEENKGALTSRQQKNLEKLNGERAKTIFILSELGYTEQEIAEYTCTSVDSVRTMTNNNKRITDFRSSQE
jgi:tetratricopeptide (TPR) repeat protein